MEEGYVHAHRENGISTIEFFHPLSNSMPGYLLKELSQKLREEDKADGTVIILKSAGTKAFCAGASFNELVAIQSEEEGLRFFSGFSEVINSMRTCKKIIIGRIHGKAVGGGVGIAAASDYVFATSGADIKLSELALGIGPFVIGPAVERKIGVAGYSELAIDASSWRTAQWAKEKGLYNDVYNTSETMDEHIKKLAETLSNYSREAVGEMKKVFWEGTDHWEPLLKERAAISGRLVLSEATRQAIAKFQKRH